MEIVNLVELVRDGVLISNLDGKVIIFNRLAEELINQFKERINNNSDIEGFALDENEQLLLSIEKVSKTQNNGIQNWTIQLNKKLRINATSEAFLTGEETYIWITLKKMDLTASNPENSNIDVSSSLFLSNIAHEIRTPLNGIIGFSEILLKKTVSKEKHNEYLSIIYSNGNYLMQLITEMLDLSRLEAGKLQLFKSQFSINRLLYELQLFFMLDMKNKHKDNIQLIVNPGFVDGNDLINADELRIKQVIINLIGNSIKFTEKGEINISYKIFDSQFLEFCVRDTGLGMSEEAQKRVFDRFEQADDNIERHFGGSGIGLTISKELVEMHGGRIWVESDIDKGTSFYFTLPYGLK